MNKYGLIALLAVMLAVNMAFAATGLTGTLSGIASQLQSLLPIVALVMIVLAGVIYAGGQVMGAEMRSRAVVWAQSLLIGAIIGLIIAALAPVLISLFSATPVFTAP